MENRLLVAFILSLGVFVGWGYIMSVIEGPPASQTQSEKELAEIPPPTSPGISKQFQPNSQSKNLATSPALTSPKTNNSASDFPGKETTIRITTGIATYLITNKGAMLKNISLSKHKTEKGEPIDLVDQKDGAILPLALESNNNEVTNILQNAFYQPSTEFLELSDSRPTGTLKMQLTHASGLSVLREFTFRYNDFMVDINTQIKAPALATTYYTGQVWEGK